MPDDPRTAPRILPGDAYADILIPSIGLDMVVVQGTDYESLKKGPGHYLDTADPWDGTGRVGIAGHRTTYLHPFFDLDQVQDGDTISLLTRYGRYDYDGDGELRPARSDRRQGARADDAIRRWCSRPATRSTPRANV